jgi:hypothetical protein
MADSDEPALQSISIRAFVRQLEAPFTALPPRSDNVGEETALASIADVKPRKLPPFYVLACSTLRLDLEREEVLRRIELLIRAKSLSYTVDLDTACIECRTSCALHFALHLWINKDARILVEVQRRDGCAILMQRAKHTLFEVLKTGVPPTTCDLQRCHSNMAISPRVKQMMQERLGEQCERQSSEQDVKDCLETCEELLNSDRNDLNQLVMEALVNMTDPRTSTRSTVHRACKAILDGQSQSSIHGDFVCIMRQTSVKRRRTSFKYQYAKEAPPETEQADRRMAVLVLRALSNALNAALQSPGGGKWIEPSSEFSEAIAAMLKSNLCDPVRRPQEAALSAQCIRLLEELDSSCAALFSEVELAERLVDARRFGETHCRLLERESETLLQRLFSVP